MTEKQNLAKYAAALAKWDRYRAIEARMPREEPFVAEWLHAYCQRQGCAFSIQQVRGALTAMTRKGVVRKVESKTYTTIGGFATAFPKPLPEDFEDLPAYAEGWAKRAISEDATPKQPTHTLYAKCGEEFGAIGAGWLSPSGRMSIKFNAFVDLGRLTSAGVSVFAKPNEQRETV